MRRCLAPILYWNTKDREPPPRTRTPNPGRASSKKIASLLPAGSGSDFTFREFNFIAGSPLGRSWEDAERPFPSSRVRYDSWFMSDSGDLQESIDTRGRFCPQVAGLIVAL